MTEKSKAKNRVRRLPDSKLMRAAVEKFCRQSMEVAKNQTYPSVATLGPRGSAIMALIGSTTTSSMRFTDVCLFFPEVSEQSVRASMKSLLARGLLKSSSSGEAGRPREAVVLTLTAAGRNLLKRNTVEDAAVLLTGAPARR